MEPILIYGHPSGTSMGLVAALEWRGQPYRLCRVDMLGEMREPPYARINARHETPVLITDQGRPLSETMAIAAWLEARDPERRVSFDPLTPEADRMHQLMAFLNTGFTAAFGPLWVVVDAELTGEALSAEHRSVLRDQGLAAVIERHDKLETMVGDGPFLMGDQPTLADGLLAGVARWLEYHRVADIARWPRLAAIRRRLDADPAVVFAAALEIGEPATGSGALIGHLSLGEVIERFG
jgi:glutathione S-transferase